ncbi:unnamed protein product [Polarella glacialis]|uniref:Uncharacterized protein n=1 Tax=Polarella glacialis TaxID=89957 RepID=A0A813JJZ4_POLGL|nr:unnamed protein product [Polarella glacialis]CAE8676976.1 unnamed protein product [Polarella glacialis]
MTQSGDKRPVVVAAGAFLAMALVGKSTGAGQAFSLAQPSVTAGSLRGTGFGASGAQPQTAARAASDSSSWAGLSLGAVLGAIAAAATAGRRVVTRHAQSSEAEAETSRRMLILPAALAALAAAEPAFAQPSKPVAIADLPDRINQDPYELIGMENPKNDKEDYKIFYMKRKYRDDTYQVVKHMKISASLDKGTPNMEKWNNRIKEEMDDWFALYRRQDAVVGRQSYYSLFSAVNTLASHFTSYGPKYPFPNKLRPRFFELINTTEKYLEKGK